MIQVTLKGEVREFESGITVAEIAKSIGMGLLRLPAPAASTARP